MIAEHESEIENLKIANQTLLIADETSDRTNIGLHFMNLDNQTIETMKAYTKTQEETIQTQEKVLNNQNEMLNLFKQQNLKLEQQLKHEEQTKLMILRTYNNERESFEKMEAELRGAQETISNLELQLQQKKSELEAALNRDNNIIINKEDSSEENLHHA